MTPARYLLLPWWLLQLATGAKAFSDNPLIGSPALNRLGLHAGRVRMAAAIARRRRARLAKLVPDADRRAFDADGFVMRRDFLPPDQFAALRDQVLAFHGPAREMVQGDTITRRYALDPEALAAIPAARALLADPLWRGLLGYAGSFATTPLSYIQTILSGVHDAPADPQTALHADTFHATVKAWLFLHDVPADEGPFVYVPGSHRLTPERLAWERRQSIVARDGLDRLSSRGSFRVSEAALAEMGLPAPRAFAVPANTLIVADTFGFHARGPSLRRSKRIEIWAYGRRNPFLPWTGLDPLSIPGIAERRIPWLWRARDRFERFVGQPWRDVGRRFPGDA
ncbi:MAG: phytanoyl-CoA dioxygenase family protein [Sphingomonas sp.]